MILITIPVTTIAANAQNVFAHPNPLPANVGAFLFKFQQDNSTGLWLFNHSQAVNFVIQYAKDGANFTPLTGTETVFDDDFPAFGTVPAGEYRWAIDIPDVGTTARKVRISYKFLKSLRLSGSLEAI